MSAHIAIEGQFYFNKTPLAPPGIKVILYGKPKQRKIWGIHGVTGWCIGPAMEHYRCYIFYTPMSRG